MELEHVYSRNVHYVTRHRIMLMQWIVYIIAFKNYNYMYFNKVQSERDVISKDVQRYFLIIR